MNILIICTANICRSQLAAAYLSFLLQEQQLDDVSIETAGIKPLINIKIHRNIKKVARQNQLRLGSEHGRQINPAMLERADIILVMEYFHASKLLEINPKILPKIKMLGQYDPFKKLNKELKDPLSFEPRHIQVTFKKIKKCIDRFFLKEIRRERTYKAKKIRDRITG